MLLKIDPTDVKNHRSIADVDLGFAVIYELQVLKTAGKVTESQIYKFKKDVVQFLSTLRCHTLKKISNEVIFCQVNEMPITFIHG